MEILALLVMVDVLEQDSLMASRWCSTVVQVTAFRGYQLADVEVKDNGQTLNLHARVRYPFGHTKGLFIIYYLNGYIFYQIKGQE